MAVDADGRLRGVVTLEQVSRALRSPRLPARLALDVRLRGDGPGLRVPERRRAVKRLAPPGVVGGSRPT